MRREVELVRGQEAGRCRVLPRVYVCGVGVSAIDMDTAVASIERWIEARERKYVCVTGAHGVAESVKDPALREIHNCAGLVTPDGMPLVWISRLRGFSRVARVYGPDLMLSLCERSQHKGYSHFFYGSTPAVLGALVSNLRRRFPRLAIAGAYSPPLGWDACTADKVGVELINAAAPDIVWVGLGTPKQERWMAARRADLSAPVLIGVGAAFDFLAGTRRQAPAWMRSHGLEWAFRLATEPRRLLGRYAIAVPLLSRQLLLAWLGAIGQRVRSAISVGG